MNSTKLSASKISEIITSYESADNDEGSCSDTCSSDSELRVKNS